MKRWEFALVDKFSTGMLIGFSYFPLESHNDFSELNIYLVFLVFHFKFYY